MPVVVPELEVLLLQHDLEDVVVVAHLEAERVLGLAPAPAPHIEHARTANARGQRRTSFKMSMNVASPSP